VLLLAVNSYKYLINDHSPSGLTYCILRCLTLWRGSWKLIVNLIIKKKVRRYKTLVYFNHCYQEQSSISISCRASQKLIWALIYFVQVGTLSGTHVYFLINQNLSSKTTVFENKCKYYNDRIWEKITHCLPLFFVA